MTLKIVILFIFSGWFFFWALLYVHVTEAAYPPNVKTDEQVFCENLGGAYQYKASDKLTIYCLTKDHAMFYNKNDLVTYYQLYYKEQFSQQPVIMIKD